MPPPARSTSPPPSSSAPAAPLSAHRPAPGFRHGLHDLGRGAWAWLQPDGGYGLSNAGLVVDGDQCLLIDTLTNAPLTQQMLDAMRAAVPAARRIGTVLNTHAHPDHTAGNALLPEAEVLASAATAEEMQRIEAPENPMRDLLLHWQQHGAAGAYLHAAMGRFGLHAQPQRMPTRTFTDQLTLQVGDKTVELLRLGPAHTRGDVVAWVPADRLVFTGDILFHEVHPILVPGQIDPWLAACDRILAWDVDLVVPGHGPVTDKRGVQQMKDTIGWIRHEAGLRHAAGMPWPEAAHDIALDHRADWPDAERIVGNVHACYVELGAAPRPLHEVFAETGRYKRLRAAGCAAHGAGCARRHAGG